jgi:RND superfamily putative drug exporter
VIVFARLGRLVVYRPWWVIGAWLVAAIVIIGLAPGLTATTNEADFLPSHYESIKAQRVQETAFPNAAAPAAIIVFERNDGAALTSADSTKVAAIGSKLTNKDIEHVTGLQVGEPSSNRLIQTIGVQMPEASSPSDKTQTDAVKALRRVLQDEVPGSGLKAGITGTAAQHLDSQASSDRALVIVGITTIVLILVLLLVIFRSPIIALLPIVTIGAVSQVATGLIGWSNDIFGLKTDSSVSALLIVVLFGVGTDYILFLMFRYRERLQAGDEPKIAMVNAVTRVGEAIASAAGAVIIAFLALTLASLALFRSLGPALAIAVAVTLLAGLTLIPAVVSLLGTRVFWPSKAWKRESSSTIFARIGDALGRRPAWFAIGSGGGMVILALIAIGFHPTFDLSSGSGSSTDESSVWSKELLKGLPAGATQPSDVYLRSTDGTPLTDEQLAAYGKQLASVEGVGEVAKPKRSANSAVADFRVTLDAKPDSNAAIDTVRGPLRSTAHDAAPGDAKAYVGGITSVYVDLQSAMNRDYGVVFPVAAVLIMVILGLLLRSVVAPWYLMASVGLGFAATLGAAVAVFQYAAGNNGLIFIMPIIMYLFVVALGTDYNILMVARLREEAREGRDPRDAAAMAFRHAAPTIAAAGLILAGTFASLMLGGNATLLQMGFAVAFGIVIAAFVMSMFFTPALTALIGHKAWWPGHADKARPSQSADNPHAEELAAGGQ